MKRLSKFIFTLCLFIFIIPSIKAASTITCVYDNNKNNGRLILEYAQNGDFYSLIRWELNFNGRERKGTEAKISENFFVQWWKNSTTKSYCSPYITQTIDVLDGKSTINITVVNDAKAATYVYNEKESSQADTGSSSCVYYKYEDGCRNSINTGKVSCVWVDKDDYDFLEKGYCNVDNLLYVRCGGASDIPMQIPKIISLAINLLKIATPIILIFISLITLIKAMSGQKEDEIKKATSALVRKIIAAALVFFVIAIVQFVISVVAEDDEEYNSFENCLNCFVNNSCEKNMYYKTVIGGEDYCTPLSTRETAQCKRNR